MSLKEIGLLHQKLDKVIELVNNTHTDVELIKLRQQQQNGKLAEQEKRFTEVYKDFNSQKKICGSHFIIIEDKINRNENSIIKGQGVVLGLSVAAGIISGLISFFATTKAIGLW